LRRNGISNFADILRSPRQNLAKLIKISDKNLTNAITIIGRLYRDQQLPIPNPGTANKIRDKSGRWVDDTTLSSKGLRDLLFDQRECYPKITIIDAADKNDYFNKLSKIVSVANKSRMLRLLHGDVYCAERTYRFGISDTDKCKRCFSIETITHLLCYCPYTRNVYSLLGINTNDLNEILRVNLSRSSLEIRADILGYLVFRQHIMPPQVLVQTTLEKYANGLAGQGEIARIATDARLALT
jgi:hypothetical protein